MDNKSLVEKLVSQIEIKSDGNVFHEIYRETPHHISQMSPAHVQNCELHEGDWGKVGSVIFWNYTHEGKRRVSKQMVEVIDEANKLVRFNLIEGDQLALYEMFNITIHVDTKGENNLVTWTFEYVKKNPNVPDPYTLMELCLNITKDIETHHLK